ncbi:hypothetical protein DOY81_000040 [Sarcophaga bullata]|nr:hypothetical protein DOY81_000040 [Sarcophaga bullata]
MFYDIDNMRKKIQININKYFIKRIFSFLLSMFHLCLTCDDLQHHSNCPQQVVQES